MTKDETFACDGKKCELKEGCVPHDIHKINHDNHSQGYLMAQQCRDNNFNMFISNKKKAG